MKRDVTNAILQINGKPLMEKVFSDEGKEVIDPATSLPQMTPITLRTVLLGALQSAPGSDRNADTSTKKSKAIARIELARRVYLNDVVDFTADQLADCEMLIAENFVPLVVAEAHRLLNMDYIEPVPDHVPEHRV